MKEYLGDGVYADSDGFGIVLTTENGYEATNIIVLEPNIYLALKAYAERMIEGECSHDSTREEDNAIVCNICNRTIAP